MPSPEEIWAFRRDSRLSTAHLGKLVEKTGLKLGQLRKAWAVWPERVAYDLLTLGYHRIDGVGVIRLRLMPGGKVAGRTYPSRLMFRFQMTKVAKTLLKNMDEAGVVDLALVQRKRK